MNEPQFNSAKLYITDLLKRKDYDHAVNYICKILQSNKGKVDTWMYWQLKGMLYVLEGILYNE